MRNVGIVLFIVGLLLLVLDEKMINLIGIVGAAFGLFAVLVPEKAAELIEKIKSKKTNSK